MKSCTSPSPEINIRNIPVVTLICLARCFQKLIHTPSHRLSLPPMILHAKRNLRHPSGAVKEVESGIPKRLHHLFFFFIFPLIQASPKLPSESVFIPISPLIQLNMGAEVLSLPNMFPRKPTEKKPRDRLRQRGALIC